jgi:hypothetical protein
MTLTVHNATPVALYGGGGRVCTTNGGCRSDEPCRGEAVCGAAELGGRGESTGAARRVGWLGGVGGASSERSTSTLNIKTRRHVERFVESSMLGYSFGRFRFSFRISYLPFRAMSLAAWRA